MDVHQTYCGDHFAIYIKQLHCTPETKITLYVNVSMYNIPETEVAYLSM